VNASDSSDLVLLGPLDLPIVDGALGYARIFLNDEYLRISVLGSGGYDLNIGVWTPVRVGLSITGDSGESLYKGYTEGYKLLFLTGNSREAWLQYSLL